MLQPRRVLLDMASSDVKRAMTTKRVSFEIIAPASTHVDGPRLGKVSCVGRKDVDTPNHFALGSRGAVQHLSQDTVRDHTDMKGMHTALEECEYPRQVLELHLKLNG